MKRAVQTERAPKPVGPYSQAVEVGNTLYLSGQIGIDPKTGKLREDFRSQAEQVLKNVEEILRSAGYSRADIVKVVVYITDLSRFGEFNSLYEEFLKGVDPKPARVTVGVSALPLGAQIEIEVTAVRG